MCLYLQVLLALLKLKQKKTCHLEEFYGNVSDLVSALNLLGCKSDFFFSVIQVSFIGEKICDSHLSDG